MNIGIIIIITLLLAVNTSFAARTVVNGNEDTDTNIAHPAPVKINPCVSTPADKLNPAPMTPLAFDGIHDPTNDAIKTLQDPKQSMKHFPKDRRGEVDWVQALAQGVINPRRTRTGLVKDGPLLQEMDLDIIMKQTQQMPHVRFPHLAHTKWLACSNCHPKIFKPQYEGNPVSMNKVLKGEYCGRCHDKVSFALWNCERCHSVPHEGSPPAWW